MSDNKRSHVMIKEFSYLRAFRTIAGRWYLIVIALCLGLVLSTVYICFSLPVYIANASFKIEESRSALSELVNLRNLYDRSNKAESEKFILKSRNVLLKALQSIHSGISFYENEGFILKDIYPKKPINIQIIKTTGNKPCRFQFKALNQFTYSLRNLDERGEVPKVYNYRQLVFARGFYFKIIQPVSSQDNNCTFKLSSPYYMLKELMPRFSISETQNTNILNLKFAYENRHFAKDFLNAVLDQYLTFDRTQRSASIIQTEKYIGTLLQKMSSKIGESGDKITEFKKTKNLTDNISELASNSKKLTELEGQKHIIELKRYNILQLETQLKQSAANEELQYSFQDFPDIQFGKLIDNYNLNIIKKKQLLNFYTSNAPEIKRTEAEISIYTQTIRKYIYAQFTYNSNTNRLISKKIDSIRQELRKLPLIEQQFIELKSKFDVNQKIYNYLSEKELEAQISRESIIPAASIIDRAIVPVAPVSPDPQKIYIITTLISLLFGISSIFIIQKMRPYIYAIEDLTAHTEIPIVGTISRHFFLSKKEKIPFIEQPRSAFTESIRSLRSNLTFFASEKTKKVICITSEISGEGKSFVAMNVAVSITLIDKKVLLIDTDMRKPILHHSFNTFCKQGLSQYLSGQLTINDIIRTTPVNNLDFIASGEIPPNPSELLHKPEMRLLINQLSQQYDYIILDSAPIGLVSDSKPLILIADINLFVLRCGISDKSFAGKPDILQHELKLSNFGIVLNDYKTDRFSNYPYHKKYISSTADYLSIPKQEPF